MKKKLLWILVLVVVIAGISIYFCLNNGEYKDIQKENLVQLNQEIDENPEREYLLAEGCYDEKWVLNENPDIDDNGDIINCYNSKWEQEGKWIDYVDLKSWKRKLEQNYKNWEKDGKCIEYYEDWKIYTLENYKNWKLNWEVIFYDRNWKKVLEETYINWKEDWESIEYRDGDWLYKNFYKNGRLIDEQENVEVSEKLEKYHENMENRIEKSWNKFEFWDIIDKEEFKDLTDTVYGTYNFYYDEELMEKSDFFWDKYKEDYEDKSWRLIALYTMINCSDDILNPDTYLFNLDDPQIAQEIYFKNCPKWCRYADEEDVDFTCE